MARFQFEPGPIPLHHQVYLDLRTRIAAGDWAVGERLPAERELAEQYGCSLITVRRALADLAREERLERTRGRGTFVTSPRIVRQLSSTFSFAEEMALHGLEPRTELLTSRPEPAGEAVAEALRVAVGAPVIYLERRRSAADVPLLLEQVRLSADRFPDLLEADLEHGSLYGFLAERHGCHVEHLRETLEPVLLPSREARLLGQERGLPALLLEGTAYDQDDQPVETSRTWVAGRRSKFLVESSGRWARGLRAMRTTVADQLEIEPLDASAAADGSRAGGRRR